MWPTIRGAFVTVALAGLLTTSSSTVRGESSARQGVADRSIKDGAGFFSADARARANKAIEDIYQRYHIDLKIETFDKVTEEGDHAIFFQNLARERAEKLHVYGIYIGIWQSPGRVQLEVS